MPLYYHVSVQGTKKVPEKLNNLQQHAQKLEYLTRLVDTILPLHGQWQVASYIEDKLCLATTEPTIAAQVRYLHQQYVKQMRMFTEFTTLKNLKVIVISPNVYKKHYVKPPAIHLTQQTQQHLLSTANLFTDNPEISEAFARIARNWR